MKIFSKIYNFYKYKLDTLKIHLPNIKIERFELDHDISMNNIIVIYRIGRKKLTDKMRLNQFEESFFDKISIFDQHRLTKFGVLQKMLQKLFNSGSCTRKNILNFIKEEATHDQLF